MANDLLPINEKNWYVPVQSLDKASGKEVLIRNDGVYVISGIFCGAHEARAQWAKQRGVSPMSKGELQAVRRSRTTIAN